MNGYARIVPRLNGDGIEERFDYYLGLVKKGVAGFIVFGGKLETLRPRLRDLQGSAKRPLIIASDLEQGAGQQMEGATLFPPAMAIASALRQAATGEARHLLKRLYTAFASEALFAGINTILAPVLDINTNPKNPIIATRAFGEDPETVSLLGCEMIRILQGNGVMACGKHFPGHGDTEADSHISLPVIRKSLSSLEGHELVPFQRAIDAGVGMMMLGHLSVPALDPSAAPASFSTGTVRYLRSHMGFGGIIITDAMNMGAIGGYRENEACLQALRSGVDLILHPSDPDNLASFLSHNIEFDALDITLASPPDLPPPDFREHERFSAELSKTAISTEGKKQWSAGRPFLIILSEERRESIPFVDEMARHYPDAPYRVLFPDETIPAEVVPTGYAPVVAVFSGVRAYKGATTGWLKKGIAALKEKAALFVSFGNPYTLHDLDGRVAKIHAYWDSEEAQKAVVETIIRMTS